MEIQEIQRRLLEWYRRGYPTDGDYYEILNIDDWDDYYKKRDKVWTPAFMFQLYILKHPNPTPEEAFVRGFEIGVRDGFDSGYNTALKDIENEVDV